MTPRVILDMPMTDYQATRAVSASFVTAVVNECPLRAWTDSPWNPAFQAEHAPHFDIGTALHLSVLESAALAERIVIVPFDDYRTTEARELRDLAYGTGKTPLKSSEYELVRGMSAAIEAHPTAR